MTISGIATGIGIFAAAKANADASKFNAEKQREMLNQHFEINQHNHAQALAQNIIQFDQTLSHQKSVLDFNRHESTIRQTNRQEDMIRDKINRKNIILKDLFLIATVEGLWLNDPYKNDDFNYETFRVLYSPLVGQQHYNDQSIERIINSHVKSYANGQDIRPIKFPTGGLIRTERGGSSLAHELNDLDDSIPTVILRTMPINENKVLLNADLFGFKFGRTSFENDINIGILDNDPQNIADALSLFALIATDFFYLSQYGAPARLPNLIPRMNTSLAQDDIKNIAINSYADLTNNLLMFDYIKGLRASIGFSDALILMCEKDKAYAQLQLTQAIIEKVARPISNIGADMRDLYLKIGRTEDAKNITKNPLLKSSQYENDNSSFFPPRRDYL